MQILGLYFSRLLVGDTLLKTLKELHDAQLYLPIVVKWESVFISSVFEHIKIYPAFYSVSRRATIPHALAQSICKDRGNCEVIKTEIVTHLSIYMIDSFDMPSVYALAEDVAEIFPRIRWLYLWFERGCEIVSFLLTVDDHRTSG